MCWACAKIIGLWVGKSTRESQLHNLKRWWLVDAVMGFPSRRTRSKRKKIAFSKADT
jgi:hypothetical protein